MLAGHLQGALHPTRSRRDRRVGSARGTSRVKDRNIASSSPAPISRANSRSTAVASPPDGSSSSGARSSSIAPASKLCGSSSGSPGAGAAMRRPRNTMSKMASNSACRSGPGPKIAWAAPRMSGRPRGPSSPTAARKLRVWSGAAAKPAPRSAGGKARKGSSARRVTQHSPTTARRAEAPYRRDHPDPSAPRPRHGQRRAAKGCPAG